MRIGSIKKLLKKGENHLFIRFFSPIKRMMPARSTFGYEYPADNDHREEKLSVYNRKAPYHFGWDWGIRIVQMGIWKPVSLTFYDNARIEDYYVKQLSVSNEKAEFDNQIEIFSLLDTPATISIGYTLNSNGDEQIVNKEVYLKKGVNHFSLPLIIENPKLWMPVNWGEQHLYNFNATVNIDADVAAVKEVRTGLRSVRHISEVDENEEFYRQADERGILDWQDFIFGCTTYPSDDFFLNNVKEEAIYNIKR